MGRHRTQLPEKLLNVILRRTFSLGLKLLPRILKIIFMKIISLESVKNI